MWPMWTLAFCSRLYNTYTGLKVFLASKVLGGLFWNMHSLPFSSGVQISKQNSHRTFDPINNTQNPITWPSVRIKSLTFLVCCTIISLILWWRWTVKVSKLGNYTQTHHSSLLLDTLVHYYQSLCNVISNSQLANSPSWRTVVWIWTGDRMRYHRVAQDSFILKKGGGWRRAGGVFACQRHLGNIESLHSGQQLFLVRDEINPNQIDLYGFIPLAEFNSELKLFRVWSGKCRVTH